MSKGGGKKKAWPPSWRQVGAAGGVFQLAGRGFVGPEMVVVAVRVDVGDEAHPPDVLRERVERALVEATANQPKS